MYNQYMPILKDDILPILYDKGYTLLFTDGGHRQIGKETKDNHSGPSAWAYALINKHFATPMYNSDSIINVENNAMEVESILQALKMAWHIGIRSDIVIVSDSMYALNTINGQINALKINDFKNSNGEKILWSDSLIRIDKALHTFSNCKFVWTKGHAESEGNILVDRLVNYRMDELSEKLKQNRTNINNQNVINIDNSDNNLIRYNQSNLFLEIEHMYINTKDLKQNLFTSSIKDSWSSNSLNISGRINDIPISFNPEMLIILETLKKFVPLRVNYKELIIITDNKKLYESLCNNNKALIKFKKRMIKNSQINNALLDESITELFNLFKKLNITFKRKE